LLPTRARPELLKRLLANLLEMTYNLDSLEVIIYVDDDDVTSLDISNNNIKTQLIVGPKLSMGGYNTFCLNKSIGDIIVLINDDLVINTPGWDEHIRKIDAEFTDGIYLVYANDLYKRSRFCTFPIMSRKTCELLGDPFPKDYRRSFIDVHLFDIFQRLEFAGIDRIRFLADLHFEHLHYRNGKAEYDETYRQSLQFRFADDPIFLHLKGIRSEAAKRLISEIRCKPEVLSDSASFKYKFFKGSFPFVFLILRNILFDNELPYKWRFFLCYWLSGRYLASKGYLNMLLDPRSKVNKPGMSKVEM